MAKTTYVTNVKTKNYSSRVTNDPKRADQLTKMGEKLTAEAAEITKNALNLTKDVTKMKPGVFIKSSNLTDKQAKDMAKQMTLKALDPKRADQLTKMGEKLTAEADKITKNALKLTKDVTKMKPGIFIKSSNLTDKQAKDMAKHMTLNAFRFVEHLQQWIERNSQPRRWLNLSKWFVRREPSRWAKRGPMSRKDWVRFYNWAATNALPKPEYKPKTKEEAKTKKKPRDPNDFEQLMENIKKLAVPRKPRNKYEYPAAPDYSYAPQLHPTKPPKKDRGRPFAPPEVPEVFQHIDLEIDFWSQLRFPLRPSTATYNPSDHILKLAQPRITPPAIQHCPIPEKPIEYVAPRRRMTRRQWQEHLRRIEYLAKPVYRPVVDIYYE